jgi:hypothetical protein
MSATLFQLGYLSTIKIDTANLGDFVANASLGGWTTGTLSLRRANVDSTNVDTAGYEGKEYGIIGAGLTLECLDDTNSDTAQDTLLTDYWTGVKRWIQITPHVGTGYLQWEFQLVISTCSVTKEQGGIVRFSLAGDSHGTITKQDQ